MTLPIRPPYPPMEALSVAEIPTGTGWQYEPKWDGFRCLAFRDGPNIELQSKAGQTLARYFPELVAALAALKARQFVFDGEIVVPEDNAFSFDELLMRIHPAESRVRKLAAKHPALFIAFDLLVDEKGRALVKAKLSERRRRLEIIAGRNFPAGGRLALSPVTPKIEQARKWFGTMAGLDGIIAKRMDLDYRSGERRGMVKIKKLRTADCVVGGFRYASRGRAIGSLLLGLYDESGLLQHVGFTSGMSAEERKRLAPKLEALIQPPGFTGRAPGGPSRWASERSVEWQPLEPKLVVEVQYDHFTGGRFRHGTRILRWRPDKAPRQCRMKQVEQEARSSMRLLKRTADKRG